MKTRNRVTSLYRPGLGRLKHHPSSSPHEARSRRCCRLATSLGYHRPPTSTALNSALLVQPLMIECSSNYDQFVTLRGGRRHIATDCWRRRSSPMSLQRFQRTLVALVILSLSLSTGAGGASANHCGLDRRSPAHQAGQQDAGRQLDFGGVSCPSGLPNEP